MKGLKLAPYPTIGELAREEQERERESTPKGMYWTMFRDYPQQLLQMALEDEATFENVLPLLRALNNDRHRKPTPEERRSLDEAAILALQQRPPAPAAAPPSPKRTQQAPKAEEPPAMSIPDDIKVKPFFWLD